MKADRLLKLADFLDTLEANQFNFKYIVAAIDELPDKSWCGSVCCAIGWMPAVFPELVKWGNEQSVLLVGDNYEGRSEPFRAARIVFGLNEEESSRLFLPWEQSDEFNDLDEDDAAASLKPGNIRLRDGYLLEDSTAKEVADNIRHFVENYAH